MHPLAEAILGGSRRALARALTVVENEAPDADALIASLYPHTGRAWVIGITGAPGTGKSTLVTALAQAYRAEGKTVGIVAVDPTSPFTGGAILGDRIRMRDLSGDSGVFIRSMATRGSLGGLARTTRDLVRVIDAAGFDIVLIETVGAGQSEVEIVRTAQTTLVVEAPGLGDDVQAIKAGILEIADILVVNKADRPGAENTVRALRAMLELGHPTRKRVERETSNQFPVSSFQTSARESASISSDVPLAQSGDSAALTYDRHHGTLSTQPSPLSTSSAFWSPPVMKTVASRESKPADDGIAELVAQIAAHHAYLIEAGALAEQERERISIEMADRLRHALYQRLMATLPESRLESLIDAILARETDPRAAVIQLLDTAQ